MYVFKKFSPGDYRTHLMLSTNRAKLYENKLQANISKTKSEIVDLIRQKKEDAARIKIERYLLDEKLIRGYQELVLHLDVLASRVRQVHESKVCPADLAVSIQAVIFCESRMSVEELGQVREDLKSKYGKKWVDSLDKKESTQVPDSLQDAVSLDAPTNKEKIKFLTEIFESYKLDWSCVESLGLIDFSNSLRATPPLPAAPSGESVAVGNAPPMEHAFPPSPETVPPQLPELYPSAPRTSFDASPPSPTFHGGFYAPSPKGSPSMLSDPPTPSFTPSPFNNGRPMMKFNFSRDSQPVPQLFPRVGFKADSTMVDSDDD